ncbi:MAG TPA: GNAT family N-acetyltransferase [Streptosporangiaceae bacterium]|jgi:ribosomal protein S18 acetylase RimI-like enzyme
MRMHTVQLGDWRQYREIRLAALRDAPSAFASTWQKEQAYPESRWTGRARGSEDGESATIVAAVDDTGRWAGVAGGFLSGDRDADAELISMWVAPDGRGHGTGQRLVSAVLSWAEAHEASAVGLWVNVTNQPAIGLYERAGFRRTGETAPLPSDPLQREMRMIRVSTP